MRSRNLPILSALLLTLSCNARSIAKPGHSTQDSPEKDARAADSPDSGLDADAGLVDDGFVRLQELTDENPDPHIVEVSLEAQLASLALVDDTAHTHRTYNGTIPGPLIRANKGDQLIVKLKNSLADPTTIHWHGMRVPNGMDGVPGVTQEVVAPGGSFRYEYPLLDASAFWYHPHFQTLEQVGDGLYGAVLVSDPDEPPDLGRETVMAISDISLFEDGTPQHHPDTDETTVFGREGATLLVNGQTAQRMQVTSGERLRFRVLNMARSRYLALQLTGHSFLRIGGDGGLNEFPVEEAITQLTPGERADLIVEPHGEPGTHVNLVTLPVERGAGATTAIGPEVLIRLEFKDEPKLKPRKLPALSRDIPLADTKDALEIQMELTVGTEDEHVVMGINGVPFEEASPLHAIVGEPQIWRVVNETGYSHPFHLHGFHFQVLDESGTAESPLRYKDTIDIPPQETRLLVPIFEARPGKWMFHCHILDHAEAGMMGVLELSETDEGNGWEVPPGGTTPAENLAVLSVDDFAALVATQAYREPPWVAETATARPRTSPVSPHGDVRVFANDTLLKSLAKGNAVTRGDDGLLEASLDSQHDTGSMAVKEFYEGDQVVGHAVYRKLAGPAAAAAYYCEGPQSRCGISSSPPAYGEGFGIDCGFCHGGVVFTVNFPEVTGN